MTFARGLSDVQKSDFNAQKKPGSEKKAIETVADCDPETHIGM
jgi:hypothetical protein